MYTHTQLLGSYSVLAATVLLWPGVTVAEVYRIPDEHPEQFGAIEEVVEPEEGGITRHLEQAQCGGWDWEQELHGQYHPTRNPEGKISRVIGVPGRGADPLGNVLSGLGKRYERGNEEMPADSEGLFEDGYVFPDSSHVQGWSTSCTQEELAVDGFPNPERLENCSSPEDCFQLCTELNQWQRGVCLKTVTNPRTGRTTTFPVGETRCQLNRAGKDSLAAGDEFGGPCRATAQERRDGIDYTHQWLYCCTNTPLSPDEYNVVEDDDFENKFDSRHPDFRRNCLQCSGDGAHFVGENEDFNGEPLLKEDGRNETGCRWGLKVGELRNDTLPLLRGTGRLPDFQNWPTEPRDRARQYKSFFRMYTSEYCRAPVKQQPGARHEEETVSCNARRSQPDITACYGIYDEYDPKTVRTAEEDHRCVMGLPAERFAGNNFVGRFGAEDVPPPQPFEPRRAFDEERNTWNPSLGDSFSLLNQSRLTEEFKGDITFPLLSLDTSVLQTTPQLSDNQPFSDGALLRSFDDTVQNETDDQRIVIEWWQNWQTQMHSYFTPPVILLRLPALSGILGSGALERFLEDLKIPESSVDSPTAERSIFLEPVEVQIQAREDILGEVTALLEKAVLLNVEEFPVPVVVPLISPAELTALEHQWCRRFMQENGATDCSGADGIVQRLREYQEHSDDIRALRGELARYAGALLAAQQTVLDGIRQWNSAVRDDFEQYLEERQTREEEQERWQEIQQQYRTISEIVMQPWCHNERYTTAIFSLINWLPSRRQDDHDDPRTARRVEVVTTSDGLPTVEVHRQPDIILDFSLLKLQAMKLKIPVLQPVQVRLNTEALSALQPEEPNLPPLPPVPSLDDLLNADDLRVVTDPENFPRIASLITFEEVDDLEAKFDAIEEILTAMSETYDAFWKSFDFRGAGVNPQCSFDRPRQCDFLSCPTFGEDSCVHTEPDLKERWQRATARPGLLLPEDLQSIGEQRSADDPPEDTVDSVLSCPPTDFACQTLNPERQLPAMGWQITAPSRTTSELEERLQALRTRLRQETLPVGSNREFPYKTGVKERTAGDDGRREATGTYRADQLIPAYAVPPPIELSVGGAGQSSARRP